MNTYDIGGTPYGFSACGLQSLGASEYTLVGIAVDDSSSVGSFSAELTACLKRIVGACRHSPRSDNLLLRVLTFANKLDEVHGFKPLVECMPKDYDGMLGGGGMTALCDASLNVVESLGRYGQDLMKNDFDCNGIVFVLTDGGDNHSSANPRHVKQAVGAALSAERLESLRTVLVGVNTGAGKGLSQVLRDFKDEAGFDQYVDLANASESTLAKLAAFVSQSISTQSRSLGTGSPGGSLHL